MQIDSKIVMTGILGLALIETMLIICNQATDTMTFLIVAVIALCVGVLIPSPKLDKRGVFKW